MLLNNLLSLSDEAVTALPIIRTVLIIVEVVLAIALMLTIFLQPANTTGVSAIDNSETYYTKNKKTSLEGIMKMATTIISITMAVIAIVFFVTLCFYRSGT